MSANEDMKWTAEMFTVLVEKYKRRNKTDSDPYEYGWTSTPEV